MKALTLAGAALAMAVTVALATVPAHAYVTYNRLGYVSCNACHFASTGGGILTPYGRSVSSAMALFSVSLRGAMPS